MRVLNLHMVGAGVGEYRHWMPSRALHRAGHIVTYFTSDNYTENAYQIIAKQHRDFDAAMLRAAKAHQVIHAGYTTTLAHVEILVALRNYANIPFVIDIDDDFLNVPSYNVAFPHYHKGSPERRIARMCLRVADAVSVTTPALAELVKPDARRVHILPNCHDASQWEGLPVDPRREEDESIRVMFAGGTGRFGDLEYVRIPIERAMAKYPQMRLLFMGCTPSWAAQWMPSATDPHANRTFVIRHAPVRTYRAILRWLRPDIFISPVELNKFNRSKSHIKAYDAAESGAAFLCSDWDTYADVPRETAIKVNGEYEWTEALGALIEDASMRKRLNTNARDWLTTQAIDGHINKWVKCYENVCALGPVREFSEIVHPIVTEEACP